MKTLALRSPSVKVGGVVHFGRMLDKIRAHAAGQLPAEYQANLGKGFDGTCVAFLRVPYERVVERTLQGGSDEEVLQWCFAHGHQPTDEELHVWNEYLRKRGWRDDLSEILNRRKTEAGMAARSEIQTFFDFIDADEGRPVPAAGT